MIVLGSFHPLSHILISHLSSCATIIVNSRSYWCPCLPKFLGTRTATVLFLAATTGMMQFLLNMYLSPNIYASGDDQPESSKQMYIYTPEEGLLLRTDEQYGR